MLILGIASNHRMCKATIHLPNEKIHMMKMNDFKWNLISFLVKTFWGTHLKNRQFLGSSLLLSSSMSYLTCHLLLTFHNLDCLGLNCSLPLN